MKEKQYDPARHNETSPAEGMASVNTHNPEEKEGSPQSANQQEPSDDIIASKTENDKNKSENYYEDGEFKNPESDSSS